MIYLFLHAYFTAALAYALALAFGHLTPLIAAASLVLAAVLALVPARRLTAAQPGLRILGFTPGRALEVVLFVAATVVSVRHFAWLLFRVGEDWYTLLSYNVADLPLHLDFMRAIANRLPFPPPHPNFASEELRYPLAADLFGACFEILGLPTRAHLFYAGMVGALASLVALRRYAGWLGLGAFVFGGSLTAWGVLQGRAIDLFAPGLEWKNLFLSVFVTQRGFLMALPAGLLLLINDVEANPTFAGVLWGLLPLAHLHTFVAVSALLLVRRAARDGRAGLVALGTGRAVRWAAPLGLYFVLRSTRLFAAAGVVHWESWLTERAGVGEVAALLKNFGPWLLLPVAAGLALWRRRDHARARELAALVLLFALCLHLIFAPWKWDNIKLLLWIYLAICAVTYEALDRAISPTARALAAALLFFPGVVTVGWSLGPPSIRSARLISMEDLARTGGALRDVPRAAVFAARPIDSHVLNHFGRLRALGSEAIAWSHGLDVGDVARDVDLLMRGQDGWAAAAERLGVTHIFWGAQERDAYGADDKAWMRALVNVSPVDEPRVYRFVAEGKEP